MRDSGTGVNGTGQMAYCNFRTETVILARLRTMHDMAKEFTCGAMDVVTKESFITTNDMDRGRLPLRMAPCTREVSSRDDGMGTGGITFPTAIRMKGNGSLVNMRDTGE